MSLFRAKEFWATQSEDDEYFDQNSLITTIINGDSDVIITGSQSGVLRIFKPSCELSDDGINGFSATDLLLEKIFDYPILQIGCGRLVSGTQHKQLAILHPRLLAIYSLKSNEGITEHGTQNYLEHLYEHSLRRSSVNLIIGPFGGTQNRDFICVQSLDGMLHFFEQENDGFCCFIPDFLLPSPIAYVKKSDNFITCNSNWCLVSYKYKTLSEAGESRTDVNSTRKIDYDWSYNLGEYVIDISVVDDTMNKEEWIMVLGERNLFCFNGKGKVKFMKRLDYLPVCYNVYVVDDNIISLVISETSTLLVYENISLKWSAHLHFLPVTLKRVFLKTIKGALVLLSEDGRLECCYLGTEPILFVAPPVATKEIDFEKAEEELNNLNKILKRSEGAGFKFSKSEIKKEVSIQLAVSPDLVPCTFENNLKDIDNHMCPITVDVTPRESCEEVQVCVCVDKPLMVVPKVQFYTDFKERTSFTCYAFLHDLCELPSLNIEVVATIVSKLGMPQTIIEKSVLPVKLVYEMCRPQKESTYKVTVNISQSPVSLATLFPECVDEVTFTQSSNAIGFNHIAGAGKPVTILLAKSSGRYRLQSDSFASLSSLIELLIFRLKIHFSDNRDLIVFYNSSLPANEVNLYVNNHFTKRQRVKQLREDLSQLSTQFRIIQKKLLSKFKARNPTPLTNLELLLQDTYNEIMDTTELLDRANSELTQAQIELSCTLCIVQNIIGIMDINQELKETLMSTFCNTVRDCDSQSWEDYMDMTLCYLLRTYLAKSEKDKLRAISTTIEEIKDITKLEKHISQVFERIPKKSNDPEEDVITEEDNTTMEPEPQKVDTRPIGSQFGESSLRLLSARKSLLKRRNKNEN